MELQSSMKRLSNPQKVAAQLKALSEPIRFRIVDVLRRSELPRSGPLDAGEPGLCLTDLESRTGVYHSLIAHHVGVLRRSGLIEAEPRGRWTIYRLRANALPNLARALVAPVADGESFL